MEHDRDGGSAGQRLERWTQSASRQDRRMNPPGDFLEILRDAGQPADDVGNLLLEGVQFRAA